MEPWKLAVLIWLLIIYQRRTKNGIGRLTKTVLQVETVKTQRVEMAGTISAIDEEVRFFFIFLNSLLVKNDCEMQINSFFLKFPLKSSCRWIISNLRHAWTGVNGVADFFNQLWVFFESISYYN